MRQYKYNRLITFHVPRWSGKHIFTFGNFLQIHFNNNCHEFVEKALEFAVLKMNR